MNIDNEALTYAASVEAWCDGRTFEGMSKVDKDRYLGRARKTIDAYYKFAKLNMNGTMTIDEKAPDEIWARYTLEDGFIAVDDEEFTGWTKYIRADLAPSQAPQPAPSVREGDTAIMEALVRDHGGHSVTIVRDGQRLVGWNPSGRTGAGIAISDLIATLSPPQPAHGAVEALREALEACLGAMRGLSSVSADRAKGLAGASLAQPASQEGWREPDKWRSKLNLWFFRDLSDEQRLRLFSVFGLPVDEIGKVHSRQRKALNRCLPAAPSKGA